MLIPNYETTKTFRETGTYDLGDGTFVTFGPQFKHLGSTLNDDIDDTMKIGRRLSLAKVTFGN